MLDKGIIVEKVKKFFKEIKWYEYAFVGVSLAVLITLSIIFHSHIFYILSSSVGVVAVLFLTKVNVIGIILSFVQITFYAIISYLNGFYGEMINNLCVTLPLYVANLITWLKNLYSKSGQVKINSNISWKEIVVAILVVVIISFGMYFLLDYFNTTMVFVSTLSFTFNTLAIYFLARRSSLNFVFYIFNNIANFTMWGTLIITTHDLSMLITLINVVVYFLLNCYGLYNWFMTRKKQENEDTSFDQIMKVLKSNI